LIPSAAGDQHAQGILDLDLGVVLAITDEAAAT
jgi:hypothetical protein